MVEVPSSGTGGVWVAAVPRRSRDRNQR